MPQKSESKNHKEHDQEKKNQNSMSADKKKYPWGYDQSKENIFYI